MDYHSISFYHALSAIIAFASLYLYILKMKPNAGYNVRCVRFKVTIMRIEFHSKLSITVLYVA